MPSYCRAKDPSTCRVHGVNGTMEQLQHHADVAAKLGNVQEYIKVRAKMDSLKDDPYLNNDIAPDQQIQDEASEWVRWDTFYPSTPDNILVNKTFLNGVRSEGTKASAQIRLRQRGYTDKDIIIATYFGLGKKEFDSRTVQPQLLYYVARDVSQKSGQHVNETLLADKAKELFGLKDSYFSLREDGRAASFKMNRYDAGAFYDAMEDDAKSRAKAVPRKSSRDKAAEAQARIDARKAENQ